MPVLHREGYSVEGDEIAVPTANKPVSVLTVMKLLIANPSPDNPVRESGVIEWFDVSGLGPLLARLRRRIDRLPDRTFSDLSPSAKLGRVGLIVAVLALLCAPFVWMFTAR
jgi:hypothetical protein